MEPVVNGLEEQFSNQIEFQSINANSPDGREAFQHYRLQGHPAYILIDENGAILWSGLGEQTLDSLVRALGSVIEIQ